MMIKKNINLLFLILCCLAGACLNYEQVTTLKIDSSGEMFIHYWTKWNSSQDTTILSRVAIFNQDSVHRYFSSNSNTINRINVFRNFQDSTIHTQIELTFSQFDSLNQTNAFNNAGFTIKDGPDDTKIFSQFIAPFVSGFGIDNKNYTINYIYYLPGKILNHNANEISKNKLTWNFNPEEIKRGKTIMASYRQFRLKETPPWIYFLALIVIIVVVVFLFRKRSA